MLHERVFISPRARRIRFVSAPCGAGKTELIIAGCAELRSQYNVLIVIPTLELTEEVATRLHERGVPFRAINSEQPTTNNVAADVQAALKDAPEVGLVLLVTWQTYSSMPYFSRRSNWRVVIDEVPQLDTPFSVQAPRHRGHLIDHVQVSESRYPQLLKVSAKHPGNLRKMLEGDLDSAEGEYRPLYRHVVSDYREVLIEENAWKEFASEKKSDGCLYFVSLLLPDLFEDTILLGANLEQSLLCKHFERHYPSCRFEEDHDLASRLRYRQHDFSKRVRVYYFDHKQHSKSLQRTITGSGATIGKEMEQEVIRFFEGRKFGYVVNNDWKANALDAAGGEKIPVKCQGQNRWSDLTGIYIACAQNRPPLHMNVLLKLGLERQDIALATGSEDAYQAIMRTNLRDPYSDKIVDVVLPDRHTACHVARMLGVQETFPIACFEPLKIALTQTDKDRRSDLRKEYQKVIQRSSAANPSIGNGGGGEFVKLCLPEELYSTKAEQFTIRTLSLREFGQLMRKMAKCVHRTKEERQLFNSSAYAATESETFRRSENVRHSTFLILDFDNGDLSSRTFIKLFGSKAPSSDRLPFIICNTFSCSPDRPNKFRVMVMFAEYATSKEAHTAAKEYIVALLEEKGWDKQQLALDPQSGNWNHVFHLPCTNPAHRDSAFFETHNMTREDILSYGLRPDWMARPETRTERNLAPVMIGEIPREMIDAVTAEIRGMRRDRHHEFFVVACRLASLRYKGNRLSEWDIERELEMIAGSEIKMRKKIPGCMKSLRSYGRV